MNFSNPNISIAGSLHNMQIKLLLDMAYRGESSKQGWTHEANLIIGDTRASIEMVNEAMQNGSILTYLEDSKVIGCVHLQIVNNKMYLGMFAVKPNLQGGGIGKALLNAANEYSLEKKIKIIFMKVVSVRLDLIDWYKRHGFYETGLQFDFVEDEVTGVHTQELKFIELEKKLD